MKMKFICFFSAALLLAACNNAGNEGTADTDTTEDNKSEETAENAEDKGMMANDGTYRLEPAESAVNWQGEKVTGEHVGTVKIASGNIQVENGMITGGTIVMDMATIENKDLEDDPENQGKLVGHLKSDDFFSVESHPEATFEINNSEKSGDELVVNGVLTIKDISEKAQMVVKPKFGRDGSMKAEGEMTFDRTNYDIRFRSGKFFEDLGDQMIYDDVNLNFQVKASKADA